MKSKGSASVPRSSLFSLTDIICVCVRVCMLGAWLTGFILTSIVAGAFAATVAMEKVVIGVEISDDSQKLSAFRTSFPMLFCKGITC